MERQIRLARQKRHGRLRPTMATVECSNVYRHRDPAPMDKAGHLLQDPSSAAICAGYPFVLWNRSHVWSPLDRNRIAVPRSPHPPSPPPPPLSALHIRSLSNPLQHNHLSTSQNPPLPRVQLAAAPKVIQKQKDITQRTSHKEQNRLKSLQPRRSPRPSRHSSPQQASSTPTPSNSSSNSSSNSVRIPIRSSTYW